MELNPATFIGEPDDSIDVIIFSQVRLFQECVGQALDDDATIHILASCSSLDDALDAIERFGPAMVLIDAGIAGGASVGARLNVAGGGTQLVAMALEESERNILAWAEAGIAGYIADTARMRDFPRLLRQIRWGQQPCASHVVGGLLRRIGRMGREIGAHVAAPTAELTPRERVIQRFIAAGLSNKEIARRLDISVGTTKSHVHNILAKLNLRSRAQVAARLSFGRETADEVADT